MRHVPTHTRVRPALAPFLSLALALSGCGGGYGGGGGGSGGMNPCGGIYQACPNPTVSITAPANGVTVSGTQTITASASASSANGLSVKRVDFKVDGTIIGSPTSAPYSVMWDTTKSTNASHTLTAEATDSAGDVGTSSAVVVTVQNAAALSAVMAPSQIFPAPASQASGAVTATVQLETGAVTARVALRGMAATAVTLNQGFAGASGPVVFALNARAGGEWQAPADALLTAEQTASLMQGGLYVIATSASHPRGELRAQLVPGHTTVTFSALTPTAQAAALGAAAEGIAATTIDRSAGTVTIHVNSRGVADAHAAELLTSRAASGGEVRLAALGKDAVNMGHWSTELLHVDAAELARFASGAWSVSVATPALPEGALRGEINVPPQAQ